MTKKAILLVGFTTLLLGASLCTPPPPPPCELDADCAAFCSPAVGVCITGSCVCFSPDDPFLARLERDETTEVEVEVED